MLDAEITDALKGDNQLHHSRAVGDLLNQIKPALIHYVKQNSGEREDGVGIANDVIVALWKAIQAGKFELRATASLSTWCNSTGRNLWLKELRRRRSKSGDNASATAGIEPADSITPIDLITDGEDDLSASERRHRAWRAFNKLGPDCQRLFQMDLKDQSAEEIMQELGYKNLDFVRLKRFRCKKGWIDLYGKENGNSTDGAAA